MLASIAVQSALVAVIKAAVIAGLFVAVKYDLDGVAQEDGPAVLASVEANEIAEGSARAELNRREYMLERRDWRFEALVSFHTEARADKFLDAVRRRAPVVPPAGDALYRQIRLEHVSSKYEHPPRQNASGGTRLTMIFRAVEGPA